MEFKKTGLVLFALIFALVYVSIAQAQVSIQEDPIDIFVKVGDTKNFSITVNNTFNFSIFDMTFGNFTDLGFIFGNTTIPANSQRTITFSVTPTESISGLFSQRVEFNFLADIPIEITTYFVNITSLGFKPDFNLVREGDTVSWKNEDTIFHNLFSSLFNVDLQPNDTFSQTFNTIGVFNYIDTGFDEFLFFNGIIEVISRTSEEEIHNPNNDFFWNVNLNLFLNKTLLSVELQDTDFEVIANGRTEGSIKITNVGTGLAENIKLTSNSTWITFLENDFTLQPTQQNFVTFNIDPIIFLTEETNQTYNILIQVSGPNIENHTREISVFIPFAQVFTDVNSAEFVFSLLEKFCTANPTNLFCNPNSTIIVVEGNGTNQTFPINVTSADWFEQKRDFASFVTQFIRLGNDVNALEDNVDTKLINIENNVSQNTITQDKNTKRINLWIDAIFILGFFLFAGVIAHLMFKGAREKQEKLALREGIQEYRR